MIPPRFSDLYDPAPAERPSVLELGEPEFTAADADHDGWASPVDLADFMHGCDLDSDDEGGLF